LDGSHVFHPGELDPWWARRDRRDRDRGQNQNHHRRQCEKSKKPLISHETVLLKNQYLFKKTDNGILPIGVVVDNSLAHDLKLKVGNCCRKHLILRIDVVWSHQSTQLD